MTERENNANKPPVMITIDGEVHTLDDRRQTAAELLALAGVSVSHHDLGRVVGQGRVEKRFADDDVIQLTPGAQFVTIFTGSTPVV